MFVKHDQDYMDQFLNKDKGENLLDLYEPSFTEYLGAKVGNSAEELSFKGAGRYTERLYRDKPLDEINDFYANDLDYYGPENKPEWLQKAKDNKIEERESWDTKKYKGYSYKELGLEFEDGHRDLYWQSIAEDRYNYNMRQQIIEQRDAGLIEGAIGFGTEFAVQIFDPINYIPIAAPLSKIKYIKGLAKGVKSSTVRRFIAGGTEGVIGNAMIEPMIRNNMDQINVDYTYADTITNLAFGAVIGGGFHSIGGKLGDWYSRKKIDKAKAESDAKMQTLRDLSAGRKVDAKHSIDTGEYSKLTDAEVMEPIIERLNETPEKKTFIQELKKDLSEAEPIIEKYEKQWDELAARAYREGLIDDPKMFYETLTQILKDPEVRKSFNAELKRKIAAPEEINHVPKEQRQQIVNELVEKYGEESKEVKAFLRRTAAEDRITGYEKDIANFEKQAVMYEKAGDKETAANLKTEIKKIEKQLAKDYKLAGVEPKPITNDQAFGNIYNEVLYNMNMFKERSAADVLSGKNVEYTDTTIDNSRITGTNKNKVALDKRQQVYNNNQKFYDDMASEIDYLIDELEGYVDRDIATPEVIDELIQMVQDAKNYEDVKAALAKEVRDCLIK